MVKDSHPQGSRCHKEHGKCRDDGPNKWECMCDAGWGCHDAEKRCEGNCNECIMQGPHQNTGMKNCDTNAACTDTIGSYTCQCIHQILGVGAPENKRTGKPLSKGEILPGHKYGNWDGWYGDGFTCKPCTVCDPGMEPVGICETKDRSCKNIDECTTTTREIQHNCDV